MFINALFDAIVNGEI